MNVGTYVQFKEKNLILCVILELKEFFLTKISRILNFKYYIQIWEKNTTIKYINHHVICKIIDIGNKLIKLQRSYAPGVTDKGLYSTNLIYHITLSNWLWFDH